MFARARLDVARDVGSRCLSESRRPCFMRCVCSDLSSTLHFALFTVSLIFLFILLIFIFIFHVGRSERSTLCASANEELGTVADNTPLTEKGTCTSLRSLMASGELVEGSSEFVLVFYFVSVGRISTGNGYFPPEPRASDSKPLKK